MITQALTVTNSVGKGVVNIMSSYVLKEGNHSAKETSLEPPLPQSSSIGRAAFKNCRRKGLEPIPRNFKEHLTHEQIKSLNELRQCGTILVAIRRPLFSEPVAIVRYIMTDRYGVLLSNGQVDYFPDIKIRQYLENF